MPVLYKLTAQRAILQHDSYRQEVLPRSTRHSNQAVKVIFQTMIEKSRDFSTQFGNTVGKFLPIKLLEANGVSWAFTILETRNKIYPKRVKYVAIISGPSRRALRVDLKANKTKKSS